MSAKNSKQVALSRVETNISGIRGVKIILDVDLAQAYGVSTSMLNHAIKRNINRFPKDSIFQITPEEASALNRIRSQIVISNMEQEAFEKSRQNLRSQIVTSNPGRGGRRYLPYAFTEHGAMMAATILNSPRAVEMSVFVVLAFIRMRELLVKHKEIDARLGELDKKTAGQDSQILVIIAALRKLTAPPAVPKRQMGFQLQESAHAKARKRK